MKLFRFSKGYLATTQPHLYLINLQFSSDLSFLLAGTPCLSRWPGATSCSFYNLLGLWIFDQEGTFFSFHTHSVHRWGRFWPLLAPLAKFHKEFAGTTADELFIFVLKIAPGKTDQAWVAIRKVFLNHISRRTEFKGIFSRHGSICTSYQSEFNCRPIRILLILQWFLCNDMTRKKKL